MSTVILARQARASKFLGQLSRPFMVAPVLLLMGRVNGYSLTFILLTVGGGLLLAVLMATLAQVWRFEATGAGITLSRVLQRRTIPREEIATVVHVPQYRRAGEWKTFPRLLVVGHNGQRLGSVDERSFWPNTFDDFAQTLREQGYPVTTINGDRTAADISGWYPRLFPVWERRPFVISMVVLVVILVVIFNIRGQT